MFNVFLIVAICYCCCYCSCYSSFCNGDRPSPAVVFLAWRGGVLRSLARVTPPPATLAPPPATLAPYCFLSRNRANRKHSRALCSRALEYDASTCVANYARRSAAATHASMQPSRHHTSRLAMHEGHVTTVVGMMMRVTRIVIFS